MTDTMRALVDATERVLKWVDPIVGDNRDLKAAEEETESVKALKDALARSEALLAGREGWKPIETAPKDGTEIILGGDGWSGSGFWDEATDCRRAEAGWFFEDDRANLLIARNCHPTHWQPLPPPPTVTMKG